LFHQSPLPDYSEYNTQHRQMERDVIDRLIDEARAVIERIQNTVQNTNYPNGDNRRPPPHHRPVGIGVEELEELLDRLKLQER
jgi:hypothetical protein